MRVIMLIGSWLMLFFSVLMIVVQLKEKKRITDPYMILFIITIIIALWMIGKMMGISF